MVAMNPWPWKSLNDSGFVVFIYANSSIMDNRVVVKTRPTHVEDKFHPIESHQTVWGIHNLIS
jgi:hypothetical protein